MRVSTGKGTISLMVVVAIWSLSLAVDLPGMAVTPIEGSLRSIFPDVTDFKIQLLTVLPNLVIIPFVLLSGKLSETSHRLTIIALGLLVYLAAAVLYLFSSTMTWLILLSCLLGAGCGLILPFSTGLIADVFTGSYRMRQMGIISAIGNLALVVATFVVGLFNVEADWHLPFLVYLIPVIPLLLLPFLRKVPRPALVESHSDTAGSGAAHAGGRFYVGRAVWLFVAYMIFETLSAIPDYYLPNLMPVRGMSQVDVSTVTSLFYLTMFIVGVFLTHLLRAFRDWSFVISVLCFVAGFVVMVAAGSLGGYVVSMILVGIGNGMAQPIFYDKATEIVRDPSRSTFALSLLMTANYVGISIVPLVVNSIGWVAGVDVTADVTYPFAIALVISILAMVVVIIRRRRFVFGIRPQYYE